MSTLKDAIFIGLHEAVGVCGHCGSAKCEGRKTHSTLPRLIASFVISDVVNTVLDVFENVPIDLILFCPACHEQHIDAPEPEKGWTNPPHKSHLCHKCGTVWRPCDRQTNGVRSIKTLGVNDTISFKEGGSRCA
jgi:hypothetical protein